MYRRFPCSENADKGPYDRTFVTIMREYERNTESTWGRLGIEREWEERDVRKHNSSITLCVRWICSVHNLRTSVKLEAFLGALSKVSE